MNEVKKLTFADRVRNAVKAFKGKPIGSVTYGIELTKCEECDKYPQNVLYICDREACGVVCPNLDCHYTTDIKHAKNFHEAPMNSGLYMEKYYGEVTDATEQD